MLYFGAHVSSRLVQKYEAIFDEMILTEITELLHWSAMGSDALGFVIDDQTIYDPRRKVKTKAYRPFYAMKMLDSTNYNRDRWTELSNVDNYVYAVQVSCWQACPA